MNPGNPKRKKTLKLNVGEEIHFSLIGISSHENDYRLVWAINNLLKFQFIRVQDLVIRHPKLGTDLEFSRYEFTDEDKYLTYCLISNRCPDGFLFPDMKNLDFLIQITGEISEPDKKGFVKKLKAVEVINACFVLEPSKIKEIRQKLPG
jgi:hypothetical protein